MVDFGSVISSGRGVLNQVVTGFFIVIGGAIIAALVIWILFKLSYKHKFRYRSALDQGKLIKDDKAREYKDKDGLVWWRLLRSKEKIPAPPSDVLSFDHKGRKVLEAYKTETGEYIFRKDKFHFSHIPEHIKEIEKAKDKEAAIKKWAKENNIISSFEPFSTPQRSILINQIRQAQLRKKSDWKDQIATIVSVSALVILVVALMIFYGDMGRPLLEMADKQNTYAGIQKETLEIIQSIKNDIQVIREEQTGPTRAPD